MKSKKHIFVRGALKVVIHLTAVLIVASLFVAAFMTEGVWALMFSAAGDQQVLSSMMTEAALLFGLSACFWAMLYIGFLYVRQGLQNRKKASVVRIRGTVLTETLIVFPVFLLLTFGLAQMAVNSMAGLLSTLGVYEAARTIAVWGPEMGHNRTGSGSVTNAIVRERGRIAAAAVITPVATSLASSAFGCDKSATFNRKVRGMAAAGLSPVVVPTAKVSTFTEALGEERYLRRGPAQFASAYCATTVTFAGNIVTDPSDSRRTTFTTNLTYNHKIAFPGMGRVFGQMSAAGYVTTVRRSYRMTQYLSPNPVLPKTNDIL